MNKKLFPPLHELVTTPFFKYYKVDLYRECPFWQENGFCMNRACGIEDTDESDIPEKWRAKALSAVQTGDMQGGVSGCYFRDDDFCFIEDDATNEGQYIDLSINPERFTGYAGDSSHNVWKAIYQENCFGLSEAGIKDTAQVSKFSPAPGFSALSEGLGTEMVTSTGDTCEEKKIYYRIISGLHASISIHICADYLDQSTGEWAPNLQCFVNRVAMHPERLSNVYFNAVLMLRAVARVAPYLKAYDIDLSRPGIPCSAAQKASDAKTHKLFDQVLSIAEGADVAHGFDEGDFFTGPDAPVLKEQFKSHFRNVSRIMDCVGCDKCRLWGKLQVTGIGTALKILFALDDKDLDPKRNPDLLQRSEVVALFNTLHRISESLASVDDFRKEYAATQTQTPTEPKLIVRKTVKEPDGSTWTYEAVVGSVLAAIEAVRRGCKGCFSTVIRLAKGVVVPKTEL